MNSLNILINHGLRTLPDSLKERKELLGAIKRVINSKHPAHDPVADMLHSLETHEQTQLELILKLDSESQG